MNSTSLTLEHLLKRNETYAEKFKENGFVKLMTNGTMDNKENRNRLLGAMQTLSNYFQKAVQLRSVLTEDPRFYQVAQEHLKEEFLHNDKLMADRNHQPPIFDPILESTSSWFAWKMLTLSDDGRLFLMHLVLETSAAIFFNEAHRVMHPFNETDYFDLHNDLDGGHEKLGLELLKDLPAEQYERLLIVQEQGWAVVNAACERIALLTTS